MYNDRNTLHSGRIFFKSVFAFGCPACLSWDYRVRKILIPERRGYVTIIVLPSPGTVQEVGFVSGSLHMSLVNRVDSVLEIWRPRHFFSCNNFDRQASPDSRMNTSQF